MVLKSFSSVIYRLLNVLACRQGSTLSVKSVTGATMVEFVMVIPAFLTLTLGIVHFCYIWQVRGLMTASVMRTLSMAATSQKDVEHTQPTDQIRMDIQNSAISYFNSLQRTSAQVDASAVKLIFPGEPGYYANSTTFPTGGESATDLKTLPMVFTMTAQVPSVVPLFPTTTLTVRASAFRELLKSQGEGTFLPCAENNPNLNLNEWVDTIAACECDPNHPPVNCIGSATLNLLSCQCRCLDTSTQLQAMPSDPKTFYCACKNAPPGTTWPNPNQPWVPNCPSNPSVLCPAPEQKFDSARCCACYCPDSSGVTDSNTLPGTWSDGKLHCGCEGGGNCCLPFVEKGKACPPSLQAAAPVGATTVANDCKCACNDPLVEKTPQNNAGPRNGCCRPAQVWVWDTNTGTGTCQCPSCPGGYKQATDGTCGCTPINRN